MRIIKIGLLGLGTVGTGVIKTIRSQEERLTKDLGVKISIEKILVKNIAKKRGVAIDPKLLTTDINEVLASDVEIIIEVIGGLDPTYSYLKQAIRKGCQVITANKELLAKHGQELIQLANLHQVHLLYEASVAGGIPILNVIRQFLRTNDILSVQGILNGTTNYILTNMTQYQKSYEAILSEAQKLGYAEADPTSDVEGYDALYKLYILSQLIYGEAPSLHSIFREGITGISLPIIQFAKELGYEVKLIAKASKTFDKPLLSVKPTLIPHAHALAGVNDAYNAVQVTGNVVGNLLFTGLGAGELPTASAVVEDLAFLLTQPFRPQKSWQEVTGCDLETDNHEQKAFIFIEAKLADCTPQQLLQFFQKEKLTVLQTKTQFANNDLVRIGLIVKGITNAQLQSLKSTLKLDAKLLPILHEHDFSEIPPEKIPEVSYANLTSMVDGFNS